MTVGTHAGPINVSLGGPRMASYAVLMEYACVMPRPAGADYFCDEAGKRISLSNPNWNDGARPIRVPMLILSLFGPRGTSSTRTSLSTCMKGIRRWSEQEARVSRSGTQNRLSRGGARQP